MVFKIRPDGVELRPTERRSRQIRATIEEALSSNALSPEVAQKLAGRLSFLTQAVFGKLGRAALAPIYARGADTSARPPVQC